MSARVDMVLDKLLLPYQKKLVGEAARFTWNCWSRQTGKSFASSMRRILRGMARKRNQFFLSAGERQSAELMQKAKQHIEAFAKVKLVADLSLGIDEQSVWDPFEGTNIKQLTIQLPPALGGIRIVGLPANPNTARGFTGDVLLDEFAIHKADREIWSAMFPTVLRGEGEIDIMSTPKGKLNMFYSLKNNPEFSCTTLTIHDAIAQGLEADAETLRRACADDEVWRQEFLCEFIDGATAFLTYEQILACMEPTLPTHVDLAALAECTNDVYVGIDIGRKRDLTVIWPFEKSGDGLVSLGRIELRDVPFREQFEAASNVLRNRTIRRCCVDATGMGMQLAEQLVEAFGEHTVEPCTFTPTLKAEAAGALKLRVQDRSIRVAHEPKVIEDWHNVEKDVTAGGTVRLTARRSDDSHSDRFWAAALACRAASGESGPFECVMGPSLAAAGLGNW